MFRLRDKRTVPKLTIHCDVAESGCAVILDISVGGVEEAYKDRNGSSAHKLLTVLV